MTQDMPSLEGLTGGSVAGCWLLNQVIRNTLDLSSLLCLCLSIVLRPPQPPDARRSMRFLNPNSVCEICHVVLLQNSSRISGAEKLNSPGLQGHDSLFPLTLCPDDYLHSHFPGGDVLRLHRLWQKPTIFIIQIHCFCSVLSLFARLPPTNPDAPEGLIASTGLTNIRMTSCWHVSGESKWATLASPSS